MRAVEMFVYLLSNAIIYIFGLLALSWNGRSDLLNVKIAKIDFPDARLLDLSLRG
jgi:hypothetical protein